MNVVVSFLAENIQRLQRAGLASCDRLASVMLTPRFRASSHVLFFILADGQASLVAKLPRLPGDNARLDREARNLTILQAARGGGYDSIPRVVACEDWLGNRMLIETAVRGSPMKPAIVRRNPQRCVESMMLWLIDLHRDTRADPGEDASRFDRLALQPLRHLEAILCVSADDRELVASCYALVEPLRGAHLPIVFEHGDLSSPNVLVGRDWEIAVVDWELAEPRGLPAGDLFFFLTYVAFARAGARTRSAYLAAFAAAFFGTDPWGPPYAARYAEALGISRELLKPLFVLYWCRYLATLLSRVKLANAAAGGTAGETLAWLRSNRYYALWRHTLAHAEDLHL